MTLRRPLRHELRDAYRFPGFTPNRAIGGHFGDPRARVVVLSRRPKKRAVVRVERRIARGTIAAYAGSATSRAATCGSISTLRSGASTAGAVAA